MGVQNLKNQARDQYLVLDTESLVLNKEVIKKVNGF